MRTPKINTAIARPRKAQVIRRATAFLMATLLAVTQVLMGIASAQVTDNEAPVVIHRQAESAGIAGELQTFLARVSDDFEIAKVTLYYRQSEVGGFQQIPMRSLLDSIGEYMIAIETDTGEYEGLQYYIEAEDLAGNTASRGYSYAPIILPLEAPAVVEAPPVVEAPVAETPAPLPAPAPAATQPPINSDAPKFGSAGILVGVGALLLLGALAAGGGGGGGGDDGGDIPDDVVTPPPPAGDTVTLTIVSDGPAGN